MAAPAAMCQPVTMLDPLPINPAVMLHFDWEEEEIHGATIIGVMGQPDYLPNGDISWWRLAILLGDKAIRISVNNDTDELIVTLESTVLPIEGEPLDLPWINVAPLAALVGRELGWCWIGRNSQGYLDAFTIAIDGIDPDYMFVGIASSVDIRKITCLRANQGAK
jgi:hypothetical protein